ncbi:MAG TPA: type II toxin-antitoxin system RelE/ParE family toxin [Vicinamibacterales bacterium]
MRLHRPKQSRFRTWDSPTIVDGIASLHTFPNRGRLGRVEGTREVVFAPLPFVAVYEVRDEVHVLRILHGARQWPPA